MSFPQGPGYGNNPNPNNNRNNGTRSPTRSTVAITGNNGKGNTTRPPDMAVPLAVGCRARGHGRADVPDVRQAVAPKPSTPKMVSR